MVLALLLLVLAALGVTAVALVNRLTPIDFDRVETRQGSDPTAADTSISVLTWNIGYAALGADADFRVDGGRHIRALDRPRIASAARFIAARLACSDADVLLIQEAAGPSFLTRGINVRAALTQALPRHFTAFWADFRTRLIPPPLRLEHGMTSLSRLQTDTPEVLKLPQAPKFYAGFLKKYYGGLVTRHPIAQSSRAWVVINLHLSAFDDGASTRTSQIAALLDYARAAYGRGDHVIIGGDWNMRLADTDFPHRTAQRHLFWVHDIAPDALPQGWHWAIDPATPTVRTLHAPYVPGETYTMVIDGFAVSPNVRIDAVSTDDLGFEHTDHHPVLGRFSAMAERP